MITVIIMSEIFPAKMGVSYPSSVAPHQTHSFPIAQARHPSALAAEPHTQILRERGIQRWRTCPKTPGRPPTPSVRTTPSVSVLRYATNRRHQPNRWLISCTIRSSRAMRIASRARAMASSSTTLRLSSSREATTSLSASSVSSYDKAFDFSRGLFTGSAMEDWRARRDSNPRPTA